MSQLLTPAEIEDRAKKSGMSMMEVCRRAGVAYSTFYRWRTGETEPTLGVYRRLYEATSEGCGT